MRWLGQKPPEWMQQVYAFLHDEAVQSGIYGLKNLKIVRLDDGTFGVASNCFFANDHTGDHISKVDAQVYTSGKAKPQQEKYFLPQRTQRGPSRNQNPEYLSQRRKGRKEKTI
jgi:hypothetical protein